MNQSPIHSSDQLIERAQEIAQSIRKTRVAVAAASDINVIDAVIQAKDEGFVEPILVGNKEKIIKMVDEASIKLGDTELIDEKDPISAAHAAVKLASDGDADAIMKGFLPTSALLKVVLDKNYNLRGKNTLSHCAVLDIPGYHKLLNLTDGGMIVRPDQEQKFQILENAVLVSLALNLSPVKIAVSGAFEKVSPADLSDIDHLIPRAIKELENIAIQGPLPFDLATSLKAGEISSVHGPVVGDADIYLADSIEECNIISKTLIQFARAIFSGVIVGAKVPISLVSRTDTVKNKKSSLALSAVIADYYRNTGTNGAANA